MIAKLNSWPVPNLLRVIFSWTFHHPIVDRDVMADMLRLLYKIGKTTTQATAHTIALVKKRNNHETPEIIIIIIIRRIITILVIIIIIIIIIIITIIIIIL